MSAKLFELTTTKKVIMTLVFTAILGSTLMFGGIVIKKWTHGAVKNTVQPSSELVNVRFSQVIPLSELITQCAELNLQPYYFQTEYIVGTTTITDFVDTNFIGIPKDFSHGDLKAKIVELRRDFLKDSKHDLEFNASPEEKTGLKPDINELQKALNGSDTRWQDVKVRAIRIKTDKAGIDRLQTKWSEIAEITVKSNLVISGNKINLETKDTATGSVPYERWAPDSGDTYTGPSGSYRYVKQTMLWDNKSGFSSSSSYEHEFMLKNYDHKAYLTERVDNFPDCHPRTVYTSTTWPSSSYPYLDTRYTSRGCEWEKLEFTAGMAKAYKIQTYKWYYTYIRTYKGNASKDHLILWADRGYRYLPCYTEWCTKSLQHEPLINPWKYSVPGHRGWVK